MNLFCFSHFDLADDDKPVKGSQNNHKKLGSAGLALHYANIITQIDTIVSLSFIQSWHFFSFTMVVLLWSL